MLVELKSALRLLNDDPRSVITVVTGEGPFDTNLWDTLLLTRFFG